MSRIKKGSKVWVTNPHPTSSIKHKKYKVEKVDGDRFEPFEQGSLVCRRWPLSWATLIPEYVVLEHLMLPDKGLRFFTTNSEWSDNDFIDNTKSMYGEVWYKEIGLVNTVEEAQQLCSDGSPTATMRELKEYWEKEYEK